MPVVEHPDAAVVVSFPEPKIAFIFAQVRNSKGGHLCMDQGIKENHTATLHPCHGWGSQVQGQHHKACLQRKTNRVPILIFQ